MTTLLETWEALQKALAAEQATKKINDLESLRAHHERRREIAHQWQAIDVELRKVKDAIAALPRLPLLEHIRWALTVSMMSSLRFLEIDTTGLETADELVRFTLVDRDGDVCADWLIRPQSRTLRPEASAANGISPAQLGMAWTLEQAWPSLQRALEGSYVLSFSQEWDRQVLQRVAERSGLEPLVFLGECLQRRATQYYHREYALTLEALCERVGHPLPAKPHQTSIDRARGQRELLLAFARAVTDVRESPRLTDASSHITSADTWDPFLDSEELP